MARASAVLKGADYVVPEDVTHVFYDVLGHRVKLSTKARANNMSIETALAEVKKSVRLPRT